MFFFEIVDEHIVGTQKIDVSTFKDKGNFIEILFIDGKIEKTINISRNGKKYIEIYEIPER